MKPPPSRRNTRVDLADRPAPPRVRTAQTATDGVSNVYRNARLQAGTGGLTGGGLRNEQTGLGTQLDRTEFSTFYPTRVHNPAELETAYIQSWACQKFIDIPVDDMLIRWRRWQVEDRKQDEDIIKAMDEAEERHLVLERLARAMKAGRLFGTGILAIMTEEAPLEEPLDISRIRPGDLKNLAVFSRFQCYVKDRIGSPFDPRMGQPEKYILVPERASEVTIHASRVLRFDGRTPLSMTGWYVYEEDWGVSEVVATLISILQDATLAAAGAHLTQEASVGVVKMEGIQ